MLTVSLFPRARAISRTNSSPSKLRGRSSRKKIEKPPYEAYSRRASNCNKITPYYSCVNLPRFFPVSTPITVVKLAASSVNRAFPFETGMFLLSSMLRRLSVT